MDAYITPAQYQAYADARGIIPNFATLDADLVLSADFINTYYTLKAGYSLPSTDAAKLAEMERAACKACELQQKGLLSIDLVALANGVVSSESASLDGVGSESVTYEQGSRATFKARTPELDQLLRPFLVFSGGLYRG
jgi:hypothetical protein